ncbi:MAG: heparinase II/III domain-containing protein, partial [Opitutaceae bacterium]
MKTRTALALGLPNLARVGRYRLGLRFGVHPVQDVRAEVARAPFFKPVNSTVEAVTPNAWRSEALYFGWFRVELPNGRCPDWHANPFQPGARLDAIKPWWELSDFDPRVGDIKTVWEGSRMDWVLAMAQRAAAGDQDELDRLNQWVADWCEHNAPYFGPNWKCGQEASIRVIHLAMAAFILGQVAAPEQGLLELVAVHLRRIKPAINYAIAQDNNHGTSEAAALFIGGSWLRKLGRPAGAEWESLGRKWLEDRVARLIEDDGSFSQYSLNYHRVVLDTLSAVEIWRRHLDLPALSTVWRNRAAQAARWLFAMTSAETGDAPNIGANDGARLLPLTDTDYRDYRPSVQLGMVLFNNSLAYVEDGEWNLPSRWLGLELPKTKADNVSSRLFDRGGYALLRRGNVMAVMRYPRFRFRPGHADALHLDLWLSGENLLRDGGSYSYNSEAEWMSYFPGTASHNT